ncbi:hypothetical protein [Marinobacter segnicrescens]|uniref:hypothetical protein n=1 Tax=Marinobacter segnicrescens TaxID=430453 RepID=UPI003A8E51C2
MFKLVPGKSASEPMELIQVRDDSVINGPFVAAGKPVDGKTPHRSPGHPREEGRTERPEPEYKPA